MRQLSVKSMRTMDGKFSFCIFSIEVMLFPSELKDFLRKLSAFRKGNVIFMI